MTDLKNATEAIEQVDVDAVKARLAELEREKIILKALLRAARGVQSSNGQSAGKKRGRRAKPAETPQNPEQGHETSEPTAL
jgi:hypothetical protein